MATFYWSVYYSTSRVAVGLPDQKNKITIGSSSVQSPKITGAKDRQQLTVRIACDASCQFERGVDPTADATSEFLPANSVEFVYLEAGHKIAVIQQQ